MSVKTLTRNELLVIDPLLIHEHPKFVMNRLIEIINNDVYAFLHSPNHIDDRDLLVGVLFAFYCRKIQGREFYIQKIPNKFPDLEVSAFSHRPVKEKPFDNTEVEVTSVQESSESFEEIISTLEKSKLNKKYQPDPMLVLVILINNTKAPDWIKPLGNYLKTSKDPFGQVFSVYLKEQNPDDIWVYRVDPLRPFGNPEILSLGKEMRALLIPNPYQDKYSWIITD